MRWALVAEAPVATIDSKADLLSVHQLLSHGGPDSASETYGIRETYSIHCSHRHQSTRQTKP